MVLCGFSKVVLNGCINKTEERFSFHDDIEARLIYLENGGVKVLFIALDFSYITRDSSRRFRRLLGRKVSLDPANIITHCLQAHAGPKEPAVSLIIPHLVERCVPAVLKAIDNAKECELSFVTVDVGKKFSMNRTKSINKEIGALTFWDGYHMEEDKPEARHMVLACIKSWLENPGSMIFSTPMQASSEDFITGDVKKIVENVEEFQEQIYYDGPVDPLAQLLVFREINGDIMGSLLRFSAHLDLALHSVEGYSAGIARSIRKALENKIGGIAAYVCGPAGNLRFLNREFSWKEIERIGESLVEAVVCKFNKSGSKFHLLERFDFITTQVTLPLHKDLQMSGEEAKIKEEELCRRIKKADKPDIADLKRTGDLASRYSWIDLMLNTWVCPTEDDLWRMEFPVDLIGIRLNNHIILGLPDEAYMQTTRWLREETIGENLIVLTGVNGYCSYLATKEDFKEGGYGPMCSIITPDGENILKQGAFELVQKLM
ncbi:MAG: hypothetical protein KAQ69_12310 [Spirochaetales bacterium]|nr:hypothetical protein [Spirochaetales bacterium]